MIDQKIFDPKKNFHGAKGLVFVGNQILVYRRDGKSTNFPFYIDLPGGGRESGECPFETFKREVKEEFGVDIKPGDILYAKQYMSAIDPSMEAYFLVAKPLSITSQNVTSSDEVPEPFLVSIEEYLALPDTIPRHVERVKEFLGLITNKK